MSDVVIFPVGKEVSANSYLTWCNTKIALLDPSFTEWYPNDRLDIYGQRVVGFLGPTGFLWENEPYPEPEGGPAARADGALVSTVTFMPNDN